MFRSELAKKLLLAVCSPLALLAVLEAALWVADFRHQPAEIPILIWNPVEDRALANQQGLFRSDPRTLWAPRPGANISWAKAERVNLDGFRGPEIPLERTPGVLRIATLGDSSTLGLHVSHQESYSGQLRTLLEAEGVPAEVLNAGVVGYTIAQGLERYRQDVRPYRPDVVIAAFGAVNEHHRATGPADEVKIARSKQDARGLEGLVMLAKQHSRLAQFLVYASFKARGGQEGVRKRDYAKQRREAELAKDAGRADWPGTRRVSVQRFREQLRELAVEVRKDGAKLVLVVMPRDRPIEGRIPVLVEYSKAVREVGQRLDAPICDVRQAFWQAESLAGTGRLFVDGDVWHPNPAGHALMARELLPLVKAAAGDA